MLASNGRKLYRSVKYLWMIVMLLIIVPILTLLWFYWMFIRKNPLQAIPGPPGRLIVGNALQLHPQQPYMTFFQWANQFGGVFKIKMFNEDIAVVSGAKELSEVLVTKGKDYADRPPYYINKVFSANFSDIPNTAFTPELRWRRKIMHSYIKQYASGIDEIEKITNNVTDNLIHDLDSNPEKPVDISYKLYGTIIDILCIMLHGHILTDENERNIVHSIIPATVELGAATVSVFLLNLCPWLRYLGNSSYKKLMKIEETRHHLIGQWLKQCNDAPHAKSKGFIHKVVNLTENEKGNHNVSNDVIELFIFQFLLAGTITTLATLSSLMNTLVHHPEIQAKLQAEVDEIVGKDGEVSITHRPNMPYHTATMYEISRYASVAPFVPHVATKDTSVDGYYIPKDTTVWAFYWGLHHDEKFWDKPFEFKPERFLDDQGELVPADHPNRVHLMPFGAGPRVCVGEILAQSRLFLIVAKIMQKFTLLPETTLEQQTSCDPRSMKLGSVLGPQDFKIKLSRR